MPVQGLVPTLMEVGKIKIGIKGEMVESKTGVEFRPPKKLDHFIITTNEKDQNGDYIIDESLIETLKKNKISTVVNKEGKVTGIPIRLLYNDIDLNFPTRYASYVSGKCACSGDGQIATTRDGRQIKCPCDRLDPNYDGRDKCKVNGTLSCIIDGADYFGGCHKFRTTSINTARSILGSLAAIKTATGGMLAFLPLTLMVQPKTTMVPTTGQNTTVFVVSVVYRGTIESLQKTAFSIAKEQAQYLLSMNTIEDEARKTVIEVMPAEEKEIAYEFYPENMEHPSAAPAVKEEPISGNSPSPADPASETEHPPAVDPSPQPAEDLSGPATREQLAGIAKLKKELKIDDPAAWNKLLIPFNVVTAKDLTRNKAEEFTAMLIQSKAP